METIKQILEFKLIEVGKFAISVYNILLALSILVATWIFVRFITMIISKRLATKQWVDKGKEYTINKLVSYLAYTIAIIAAIESLGIDISILLAGSAALFVGLGLGLQDFFKDAAAGLMLLFEGTVKVGDVVEIETVIGRVIRIDVRTSKIKTRENIIMIVPNSKLINDNVINWSLDNKATRFEVAVGVAYGSDTQKVRELMLACAEKHPDVIKEENNFVRFEDFGNSSLDFTLYFWSERIWRIEGIKSDLRFAIDQAFRDNNITIPFPQRDLHFKSGVIHTEKQGKE